MGCPSACQSLHTYKLSSGTSSDLEHEVGEARLRLDGRERTTLIVFGPEDAAPLLGATSLELEEQELGALAAD